ncbi:hypothetical protein [Geobacter sp. DSM 9736]|uniref:hypothetical protein n=1 Tax=Geobacter sp. DSM 9736 TaxID=1277350 RepID=UPI000B507B76|nr:hypothetical protein [Geobacter sp. DSM 9736]
MIQKAYHALVITVALFVTGLGVGLPVLSWQDGCELKGSPLPVVHPASKERLSAVVVKPADEVAAVDSLLPEPPMFFEQAVSAFPVSAVTAGSNPHFPARASPPGEQSFC